MRQSGDHEGKKKNLREDFPLAILGHMSVSGPITVAKANIIA